MGCCRNRIFTMMKPEKISIQDFAYDLPDDRIALRPLERRDASKLLLYKDGDISETVFSTIDQYLPAGSLLVINNTRVINARILFKKASGASIEIFCLEPLGNISEYSSVMSASGKTRWKCLVGGAAKWKEEWLEKSISINGQPVTLRARMIEKLTEAYSIELSWMPAQFSFAEIVEAAGDVPLPPYIKRTTEGQDASRYQTIFADREGSVAAPTAGLHFTTEIFEKLSDKDISPAFVTLHVGAGTFKPVKAATMQEHEMHAEYIDVNADTIQQLKKKTGAIAAVGTTSCRTIESLYWLGVKVILDPTIKELSLGQWDVYREPLASSDIAPVKALDALLEWMKGNDRQNIFTQTQLMIAPGYRFRMTNMLVTNFHQPQSTLLLLVAAAIGADWKKMYAYALANDFRFLSYGDGNLIFINA